MIKKLCVCLCLAALMGCAHGTKVKKITDGRNGTMEVSRMGVSSSFCFDGLTWKLLKSGCKKVAYERIDIGYMRYWCADGGSAEAKSPLKSEEFFIIAFNRRKGQYARPVPQDTLPLCADPSALLVTAPRD